jgi:ribosomal protein L5
MTAAFGTRLKQRLNRVMDALGFEYPDYERLDKGAEGQKRKRVVSVLNKDNEDQPKKKKLESEPKTGISKKRKTSTPKQKETDEEEGTSAKPSATEVEETLKVMNESLPVKLSPLGPHLTKLFQKEKEPAKTKASRPKRQRIITVTEVIEATPPGASAPKVQAIESITATEAVPSEAAAEEARAEAARFEDINLESMVADIDKILLNMAAEKAAVEEANAEEAATATEETTATKPEKEEMTEDTSEDEAFNFQNLVGQELTKAEKEELKEYAISCGYRPGALLFGGIDDERLGCVRDQTGTKVIGTLSKSIGFPKLETDISRY